MTQLSFNGAATVTGFPRDKAFGFEIEGDVLVIKAGKEVFLRIEKEPAVTVNVTPGLVFNPDPSPTGKDIQLQAGSALTLPQLEPVAAAPAPDADKKPRKPRGPNVKINDTDVIVVDPKLANPYSKLRGKYFETLQTANGRTVAWWAESAMVKSLEGDPRTLLKFFISEKVVTLAAGQSAGVATAYQDLTQQFQGYAQPQPQQPVQTPGFGAAAIAGASWTPPGGNPPQQGGGATFM